MLIPYIIFSSIFNYQQQSNFQLIIQQTIELPAVNLQPAVYPAVYSITSHIPTPSSILKILISYIVIASSLFSSTCIVTSRCIFIASSLFSSTCIVTSRCIVIASSLFSSTCIVTSRCIFIAYRIFSSTCTCIFTARPDVHVGTLPVYRSPGNCGKIIHSFKGSTAPTTPLNYADFVGLDCSL